MVVQPPRDVLTGRVQTRRINAPAQHREQSVERAKAHISLPVVETGTDVVDLCVERMEGPWVFSGIVERFSYSVVSVVFYGVAGSV